MTRTIRSLCAVTLGTMASALLAGTAEAGRRFTGDVIISENSPNALYRTAVGDMHDIRNSSDSVQYVNCMLSGSTSSNLVRCTARNRSSRTLQCYSRDSRIVNAVAGKTDYGWIRFSSHRFLGTCGTVDFFSGSESLP